MTSWIGHAIYMTTKNKHCVIPCYMYRLKSVWNKRFSSRLLARCSQRAFKNWPLLLLRPSTLLISAQPILGMRFPSKVTEHTLQVSSLVLDKIISNKFVVCKNYSKSKSLRLRMGRQDPTVARCHICTIFPSQIRKKLCIPLLLLRMTKQKSN